MLIGSKVSLHTAIYFRVVRSGSIHCATISNLNRRPKLVARRSQ